MKSRTRWRDFNKDNIEDNYSSWRPVRFNQQIILAPLFSMQNVTPIYRFYWSWGSTRDIELETTLYCRSKLNIIIPNYSEGIPIFADTWTSISQRYPISGLFPTAHYHSLSYYPFTNPLTAKERFIKQFYWLYSIEFTSSNCLCYSLYSPLPVLYIYIQFISNWFDLFVCIKREREERHVASRRPSLKKSKKMVSFPRLPRKYRIICQLRMKRWTWTTRALYADCLCSESELTAIKKKKKIGVKRENVQKILFDRI